MIDSSEFPRELCLYNLQAKKDENLFGHKQINTLCKTCHIKKNTHKNVTVTFYARVSVERSFHCKGRHWRQLEFNMPSRKTFQEGIGL